MSKVINEVPQEKDVEELFIVAFQAKQQWAETLITVEGAPSNRVFRKLAEQEGLSVKTISAVELEPIIGPLKESFASAFIR